MYCIVELEFRNFRTEDDDTTEAMNEGGMYRFLGHIQAKWIKHARLKQKLGEKYLNLTKDIKTNLNEKNGTKAVNTYVNPALTLSLGIVKWTTTDLENLQTKMRMLLTIFRF